MVKKGVEKNYINEFKGLGSWFTTLDHKRIALMYMVAVMFFFLLGGLASLLIRLELFSVGAGILQNGNTYNKVMTYHGAIMVFMVIIPGIPAILGNFFYLFRLGPKTSLFQD